MYLAWSSQNGIYQTKFVFLHYNNNKINPIRESSVENTQNSEQKERKKGFTGLQVFAIVAGAIVLTVGITLFVTWTYLFPKPFDPVVLSGVEKQQLETKLDQFESVGIKKGDKSGPGKAEIEPEKEFTADGRLTPQKYSEDTTSRDVLFTEREINALVATNTDLADKLAIDLTDNLISARMRVPIDPDFPFFGGKTLRIRAGVETAFREGRPVVILKGVSLMGVPLPNAWLGGIKNIDLVEEFSTDVGFWKAFGDGVESINVQDGMLKVTLKE